MKSITLAQGIQGFTLACQARRLSPHTISDYSTTLRRFQQWLAVDLTLPDITPDHIRRFLAFLATPQPVGGVVARPPRPLSKKTTLNYHTGLSAFWTWAVSEQPGGNDHFIYVTDELGDATSSLPGWKKSVSFSSVQHGRIMVMRCPCRCMPPASRSAFFWEPGM